MKQYLFNHNPNLHYNFSINGGVSEYSPTVIASPQTIRRNVPYSDITNNTYNLVYYKDNNNSAFGLGMGNSVLPYKYCTTTYANKTGLKTYGVDIDDLIVGKKPYNLIFGSGYSIDGIMTAVPLTGDIAKHILRFVRYGGYYKNNYLINVYATGNYVVGEDEFTLYWEAKTLANVAINSGTYTIKTKKNDTLALAQDGLSYDYEWGGYLIKITPGIYIILLDGHEFFAHPTYYYSCYVYDDPSSLTYYSNVWFEQDIDKVVRIDAYYSSPAKGILPFGTYFGDAGYSNRMFTAVIGKGGDDIPAIDNTISNYALQTYDNNYPAIGSSYDNEETCNVIQDIASLGLAYAKSNNCYRAFCRPLGEDITTLHLSQGYRAEGVFYKLRQTSKTPDTWELVDGDWEKTADGDHTFNDYTFNSTLRFDFTELSDPDEWNEYYYVYCENYSTTFTVRDYIFNYEVGGQWYSVYLSDYYIPGWSLSDYESYFFYEFYYDDFNWDYNEYEHTWLWSGLANQFGGYNPISNTIAFAKSEYEDDLTEYYEQPSDYTPTYVWTAEDDYPLFIGEDLADPAVVYYDEYYNNNDWLVKDTGYMYSVFKQENIWDLGTATTGYVISSTNIKTYTDYGYSTSGSNIIGNCLYLNRQRGTQQWSYNSGDDVWEGATFIDDVDDGYIDFAYNLVHTTTSSTKYLVIDNNDKEILILGNDIPYELKQYNITSPVSLYKLQYKSAEFPSMKRIGEGGLYTGTYVGLLYAKQVYKAITAIPSQLSPTLSITNTTISTTHNITTSNIITDLKMYSDGGNTKDRFTIYKAGKALQRYPVISKAAGAAVAFDAAYVGQRGFNSSNAWSTNWSYYNYMTKSNYSTQQEIRPEITESNLSADRGSVDFEDYKYNTTDLTSSVSLYKYWNGYSWHSTADDAKAALAALNESGVVYMYGIMDGALFPTQSAGVVRVVVDDTLAAMSQTFANNRRIIYHLELWGT